MGTIRVIRKPDYISWDDIAKCQRESHKANVSQGVKMLCADMTGTDLQKAVGDNVCIVAIDERSNLIGTLTVKFASIKRWYHRGDAGYICYVAVAPHYKGKGVYKSLSKYAEQLVRSAGIEVVYLHTHEDNIIARQAYKKNGYKNVQFVATGGGTNYYSTEMAKWLNNKGINKFICNLFFLSSECVVRLLWKPGRIRRF